MATDKNFVIKNGLTIGTTEVIDSSRNITSGAINSSGNITLAEYLYHSGDVDTNLRFQTDRATLTSGGGASVDAHSNGNLYLTGTTVQVYGNYNSSGNITTSGFVTIDSSTDGKLKLKTPSGESSDWNYIEFYGADDTRDGYVGTDSDGDMKFFSDKNSSEFRLESSGATISTSLTVTGDLTVNGTTTTVNQTNLDVSDNLIGLNRGASSNANDSGMLIERGSTGDNVFIGWDESSDKITFATTTNVPSDTGNLTLAAAPIQASSVGVTNIVTNKVVKYNGSILDDSNITDTGSLITLGSNTTVNGRLQVGTSTSGDSSIISQSGDIQLRVGSVSIQHNPYIRLQGNNGSTGVYGDIKLDTTNQKLVFNDPGTSSSVIGTNPMTLDNSGNLSVSGTISSSGDLAIDTDTLFVDVSTDRVGINNSSPSYPLDFPTNQSGLTIRVGDDNVNSYMAFSNPRGMVGFDNAGYMTLQGGASKGVRLNVNNSTFGGGAALTIDTSANATFAGTISSGIITATNGFKADGVWTSNEQPTGDDAIYSGYGAIGNRSAFYITNGGGVVQIGNGSVHNSNPTTTFSTSAVNLGASRVFQMNGTTVIDASRNLTDIGTITSTGLVKIDGNGTPNTLHVHDDSTSGQPGMFVTNTDNYATSTQIFYAKQYGSGISATVFGQSVGSKALVGTDGSASSGLLIGTLTADSVWIGTNNTAALTINSSQNATFAGTISSGAITSSGNLHAGDGTNISMDSSANGQLEVDGNGYQGAIALDGSAMHVYHNSSSRDLVLGTNETARLTIGGTGGFNFHSNNLTSVGTISSGAITTNNSILISYSGNDGAGRDAGLKIQNDGNDWGAYIRKASAAQYGLRIDSAGDVALAIYGSEGGSDLNFAVNGSNGSVSSGAITSTGASSFGTIAGGKTVLTGTGSTNTYSGLLKTVNTSSDQWGHITLGGSATNSITDNYYLIGRGSSVSAREMSFHIPADGNYGDSTQPIFRFASSGSDTLMTITAETGAMYVKGTISSAGQLHFTGSASIRSNNIITFNTIGGSAQTGYFKSVAAQTSYANGASDGMFNALNGYAVGTGTGQTVIDSSRNLTNIRNITANGTTQTAFTFTGTQTSLVHKIGDATQSEYSSTLYATNDGNAQLWKTGSNYTAWGGADAFNIYNNNGSIAFHPSATANVLKITSTAINATQPIQISGQTVIDSSKNLTNIATISSTHFNTNSNVGNTGDGGLQLSNGARLGFDQLGTRSWTIKAVSGYLSVFSGDGLGDFNLGGNNMGFRVNGTLVLDSSRNLTNIGTISSGAIYADGGTVQHQFISSSDGPIISKSTDSVSGIGFEDNSATNYLFYVGSSNHFYFNSGTLSVGGSTLGSGNTFNVAGGIGISGTTIVDSARNATFVNLRADGGNLIMGDEAYSTSSAYVGMKTSFQSGANDYMILSGTSDGNTYVSAKDGSAVNIRGGGNNSNNQIAVPDGTTITATTTDFRVSGNVTAYASDVRLKTNIQTIENPIEKIKKIRGVEFDWLDNIENFNPKHKHETGVIAQEIEKVIPDAVSPAPFNEEYKTVDKEKIVALLIEAIKDQQQQIEELKEEVSSLRFKN